jgi:hypothetical protein
MDLDRAVAWADGHLAAAGLPLDAAPEPVSVRPWATVLRLPTSGGSYWLKAPGPLVAFEVGLYELLARAAPDQVLTPLAVDVQHAWLLLPDGGPSLGESATGRELVEGVAAALPPYARLQLALAPHVDELLALGVTDMRPEVMPARFDEALTAVRGYDESAAERVAGMRPNVVEWCERLADSPVPASLDHNDLHAWNILAGPRFYDWGDAVVAHPFSSMLALAWVEMSDAELVRLRDLYLEPFADLAPHAELVEQLELACRVGKIARALTWHRSISPYPPETVDDNWRSAPTEWLLSLPDDSWLGPA